MFISCTCATSRRMKHLKDFEFANIPNIEDSEPCKYYSASLQWGYWHGKDFEFCRYSESTMLLLLCKDFELMQSLAITTLDFALRTLQVLFRVVTVGILAWQGLWILQIFRIFYATLLCKDFELMQSLAITTLDFADSPNLLCYFCFARNIGLAT